MSRRSIHALKVDQQLVDFIEREALPGSEVDPAAFWKGLSELIVELAPLNRQLLAERDRFQTLLDEWHSKNPGPVKNIDAYRRFLTEIGYIVPDPGQVAICPQNVDHEVASLASPQLVAPVLNGRYVINAANARWISLYDALYATDVISTTEFPVGSKFNPRRGAAVVQFVRKLLDEVVPLRDASYADVVSFSVQKQNVAAKLKNGSTTILSNDQQFVGYCGSVNEPTRILLSRNGLHLELVFNRKHPIGSTDAAGLADVVIESAGTAIMDLEDSVAAVDAFDKVQGYRNWLGLMLGTITESVTTGGKTVKRTLQKDRRYTNPDGRSARVLHGRSLLFIRNVGHLMTNPAILWGDSSAEVPEGIMDAVITVLCAKHDVLRRGRTPDGAQIVNSRMGSIYIVKPKMHGPAEVAFAAETFRRVEVLCGLPRNTVKVGIMDEERRTSVNLKACIAAAPERVVFINTGFLDRTGDEIHSAMRAGPMIRKAELRSSPWLTAYERRNVLIGLECGLLGKAQIGKGMWTIPDRMGDLLKQKVNQLHAGCNTAWVPSANAAAIHAIHYLRVNVHQIQRRFQDEVASMKASGLEKKLLNDLLTIPVVASAKWTSEERQNELDNNVQGILGYVVRWVDQGVGCSKVPDINNVGLMEDRATLRISSQHIANWLRHGVVTEKQVRDTFARMADVVDKQNSDVPNYIKMFRNNKSAAMTAALDLVFQGESQPSGYTEPLLHGWRLRVKAGLKAPASSL